VTLSVAVFEAASDTGKIMNEGQKKETG